MRYLLYFKYPKTKETMRTYTIIKHFVTRPDYWLIVFFSKYTDTQLIDIFYNKKLLVTFRYRFTVKYLSSRSLQSKSVVLRKSYFPGNCFVSIIANGGPSKLERLKRLSVAKQLGVYANCYIKFEDQKK